MPTLTQERPAAPAPSPTEVVVRVDHRRRRPSLLGILALGGVALLLVIGLGVASGVINLSKIFSTSTTDRSAPVILQRLRNLSSYTAASATFSVTVDMEKDVSILPQFLAGERAIYDGRGSVDASVDLAALDTQHVTRAADGTLVVTLPHATLEPATLSPRSHVMNRDRGLINRLSGIFSDNPTSERALQKAAVVKMNRAAKRTDLVRRAERNTAMMIERLAAAAGVDQVDVRFATLRGS